MLRKRIKKNTLKWKKIYAEQLLDMMDEEENALQKIYLTGYVLELKKNRYFAGWYKDRIVCRSLEYARYFPSAEAAEEYVHKYLGFAGMTCYICHVNWTLASCGSENMEDNEENLLEENGKILSFANYADVKQYQKQRGIPCPRTCPGKDDAFTGDLYVQWGTKGSVLEKDETDSWRERPVFDQYQLYL